MTAAEIRATIVDGRTTATEIVASVVDRIRKVDDLLHSFITVSEERALAQAAELDRRLALGEEPGPLWGAPFSVKDLYDTAGVVTTYGSRIYRNHLPATDAEAVARIRQAGGVLVGKTNTPEFGIYIRTVNGLQAETRNPWDIQRISGGSSGGAAASVGAGLTPLSLGSDGGGSIRIPAALCGTVGLAPSRGAVPRTGGYIGTRRFSTAGPIALDAGDAITMWQAIRGPSSADGLSRGLLPTGVSTQTTEIGPELRLRWIGKSGAVGAETDVVAATEDGAQHLATAVKASLDLSRSELGSPRFADAFYNMMQADRLSTGGRHLLESESTRSQLTDYARHHFERAAAVAGADYSAAVEMQLEATEHLLRVMDGADVLVTPTVPFVAPIASADFAGLPEDVRQSFVAFTFLTNYTGFPAATVPCALVRGLPVGLQLIGRPGSEDLLLELCCTFQREVFRLPTPQRLDTTDVRRTSLAT
ncbi:MAG: amidase [Haloechinothrix sp.]